jgi:hypothetical protein
MTNQDLDVTEAEIKQLEEELSKIEGSGISGMSSPTPEKKDSTLVLFRELIKADNSSKFGNLDMTELGKPSVAVRDQLDIANYLDAEGLTTIGNYFRKKAEITFATSLSKKGKLIDNIVTQIKKEQKSSASPEVKKGMFAKWGQHKEGSE